MGIGLSIFFIALGAILAFAVDVTVSGLDLVAIGVILMVLGAVGLALELLLFGPRRRSYRSTTYMADQYPAGAVVATPVAPVAATPVAPVAPVATGYPVGQAPVYPAAPAAPVYPVAPPPPAYPTTVYEERERY